MKVTYEGTHLQIDGRAIETPSSIREAFVTKCGVTMFYIQ